MNVRKTVITSGAVVTLLIGGLLGGAIFQPKKATADFDLPGLNQQVQNHEGQLTNHESQLANHEARITNTENDVEGIQQNTGTPPAANPVPVTTVTAKPVVVAPAPTPPAPTPPPGPTAWSEFVCDAQNLRHFVTHWSDGHDVDQLQGGCSTFSSTTTPIIN